MGQRQGGPGRIGPALAIVLAVTFAVKATPLIPSD